MSEGVHNPYDDATLQADIDTLLARLTALRAGYLDELGPTNLPSDIDDILADTTEIVIDTRILEERQRDYFGSAVAGLAITRTLLVNPDGDGTDGLTRRTAYPTIQAALDVASMDATDLTLILIAPHATYYDIDTTGDPTWSANVLLSGPFDDFAQIRNTHVSATSILKLTGKSAVTNLSIYQTGSLNGLIMTSGGSVVEKMRFNGTTMSGAGTSLHLDGDSVVHGHIREVEFHGHVSYTIAILIDQWGFCDFHLLHFAECLTAIQIVGANSDENDFKNLDIGDCALGLDLDAGNTQHFTDIGFHDNTRNVDDEVGDHAWLEIHGRFDIDILPDNFSGVTVNTGAANTYGADTEVISAVSRDNPFRIVGVHVEPSTSEWYRLRLSDDSGSTFFDVLQFDGTKREGINPPSGTEHIFNKGTRISGSSKDVSGGDNVKVWIEIQEI